MRNFVSYKFDVIIYILFIDVDVLIDFIIRGVYYLYPNSKDIGENIHIIIYLFFLECSRFFTWYKTV